MGASWRRELCAVATVGILWMAGCGSPSSPSGNELSLDNRDNGRQLSVRPGDEILVTLQTIGPGEYELPNVSSSAVVFLGVSILTPPNPGGPRQLFQFRIVAVGHVDISIPHTARIRDLESQWMFTDRAKRFERRRTKVCSRRRAGATMSRRG